MNEHFDESGPALPGKWVARIAAELDAILPAPEKVQGMRDALFARLRAEVQAASPARTQHLTLRADEGRWLDLGQGVRMKPLNRERGMLSYLLELAPGASLPEHGHDEDEECIVLSGDVWLGEVHAGAGDFHLARKGVPHGRIYSEGGCMLFLRGARPELPRAAR